MPKHGTVDGYNTWKCRCADCKEAVARYQREYYQRNRERIRKRVNARRKLNREEA